MGILVFFLYLDLDEVRIFISIKVPHLAEEISQSEQRIVQILLGYRFKNNCLFVHLILRFVDV